MIKLSKKELVKEAQHQEAYYFTGNVYSYENVIWYLNSLCYETQTNNKKEAKEEIKKTINRLKENTRSASYEELKELIKNIKNTTHDSYNVIQKAYSAGVYGNSGQLHEITLFNKNKLVAMYYCYY